MCRDGERQWQHEVTNALQEWKAENRRLLEGEGWKRAGDLALSQSAIDGRTHFRNQIYEVVEMWKHALRCVALLQEIWHSLHRSQGGEGVGHKEEAVAFEMGSFIHSTQIAPRPAHLHPPPPTTPRTPSLTCPNTRRSIFWHDSICIGHPQYFR